MLAETKKSILALLTENYGDLVRHLNYRLGGEADAHDVVQDTFLRLNQVSVDTVIQNPRSYLFRVADNVAVDHLRRNAAKKRLSATIENLETANETPSPERVVDYRQRLERLQTAITELSARQREAFLMHRFDGLSHGEIADAMGISKSAVEKLLMKALGHLRTRCDDLLD
ncbi:MAG: RNA polymerase sigma factor [Methyloligella sp. ZOD6]